MQHRRINFDTKIENLAVVQIYIFWNSFLIVNLYIRHIQLLLYLELGTVLLNSQRSIFTCVTRFLVQFIFFLGSNNLLKHIYIEYFSQVIIFFVD